MLPSRSTWTSWLVAKYSKRVSSCATAAHIRDDVVDLIRLLYDAVGGARWYASQPREIKAICRGLRRDLIHRTFPTARHLREYLEIFSWCA